MYSKLHKSRNLIEDKQVYSRLMIVALIMLIVSVLVRTAWVSDDAFITLRTIDNFVNGHGLTWNSGYRVQAFTHPLWLGLLTPLYYISGEPYFSTLLLSAAATLSALILLAFQVRITWYQSLLGLCMLMLSKSFTDFATSGLENPLLYLLAVLFFIDYRSPHITFKLLFFQSLYTGLLLLTRMDMALIFFPLLGYSFYRYKKIIGLFAIGTGLLPFFIWTIFSVIYYGFPYPNTAYAKLLTGIAPAELWAQGFAYYQNSLRLDPITLLGAFAMMFFLFRSNRKRWRVLFFSILAYFLYILSIGGDFMSGRFFALPFLCLIIGMNSVQFSRALIFRAVTAAIVLALGIFSPYSPLFAGKSYRAKDTLVALVDDNGICDERAFYFPYTGLLHQQNAIKYTNHPDALRGKLAKSIRQKVNVNGAVGVLGYFAGPDVFILDFHGLGDPVLARLPVVSEDQDFIAWYKRLKQKDPERSWRIGHFRRNIPQGYIPSIITGHNLFQDSALSKGWSLLFPVLTDDIWSARRLNALSIIWLSYAGKVFPETNKTDWVAMDLNEILVYDSTCVTSRFARAQQYFMAGKVDSAARDLKVIQDISSYFVSVNQQEFVAAWQIIAQRYAEDKKYISALQALEYAEALGGGIPIDSKQALIEKAEDEALLFPERTKRY
jgi:arabinofuranosyltransferase